MKKIILIFLFLISFSFGKKLEVLVLNSYHPTFTWTHNQVMQVRKILLKHKNISIHIEFMDTKRNKPTKKYLKTLLNLYKYKFN